jgi:hypothetical protein
MIFNVLDYNEDRSVCQVDLFALMKFYENDDEVFIHSFSYDICKIVAALYQKQKAKKKLNIEVEQKLKDIERRVKRMMLEKEGKTVVNSSNSSSKSDPSQESDKSESDMDGNFDLKSNTTKYSKVSKRSRKKSAYLRSRSFVATGENQRLGTAMSRGSRRSKASLSSLTSNRRNQKGLGSFKRNMDSLLASYLTSRDVDEEVPDSNPYDALFGSKIVRKIVNKKSYIEKINF